MAFHFTLPTLLGVIIGGVAFVFCLAVVVVVLFLRIKHRRQLARSNAAGERRLSRYPGGHLSITDEDVAQMPGTGAAMRESLCNRYTRASAYVPMASRESIERQNLKASSQTLDPGGSWNKVISPRNISPTRPWPLPRRLTRANRPPAIELRRSATNERKEPLVTSPDRVQPKLLRMVPRDEYPDAQSPQYVYDSQGIPGASPDVVGFPSPGLRPKPLFHEKPRSVSHGMISALDYQKGPKSSGRYIFDSREVPVNGELMLPRSVSLTSRGPGMIPAGPIPPLPAEALALRRQRSMKTSGSRQSLVAENSKQSLRDSTWSKPVHHGHTNSASPNTKTMSGAANEMSRAPADLSQHTSTFFKSSGPMVEEIQRPPLSPTVARTGTLKAPKDSRKSFQASIQDSMTRSNSSGLSESLLNHGWSRSASNASIIKEISHTRPKTPAGHNGAHISIFDFGLPARSDVDNNARQQLEADDPLSKRRSASILQMISGNEQSPVPNLQEDRPVSIATENPIRWSTDLLTKESGDDCENPGGNTKPRHRSKRASMKQQHISKSKSPRTSIKALVANQPSWKPTQSEAQSLRRPRIDPPAIRPPSKVTFEPQLTQTPQFGFAATESPNPILNSTLAILTRHGDSDSSSSSPPSTPTRKPSQKRRPSGTHPNRQRAIFDGSSKIAQWPLAGQHPSLSLGLRATNNELPQMTNNIFRLDAPVNMAGPLKTRGDRYDIDNGENMTASYRPPSLLYRFPSPPSPPFRNGGESDGIAKSMTAHSHSQPDIKPSRPARPPSPFRLGAESLVYSINNVDHKQSEDIDGNSPNGQLRQSVLALRRMNSEISETSRAGREHRRYLSLGGMDDAIFEHGTTNGTDGNAAATVIRGANAGAQKAKKREKGKGLSGPRDMPAGDSIADTVAAVAAGRSVVNNGDGMNSMTGAKMKKNLPPSLPLSLPSAPLLPSLLSSMEKENGGGANKAVKGGVRGPRAMPGWLDETMMLSSPSSYTPNVAGAGSSSGPGLGIGGRVRVTPGGLVDTDRSWYDGDGFLKQF